MKATILNKHGRLYPNMYFEKNIILVGRRQSEDT